MSFGPLETQLQEAAGAYPPDFETMERLLGEGADINACTDEETLLSEVICGYPEMAGGEEVEQRDGRYLPEVVRFFVEHGYEVRRRDGAHGGQALMALSWASYDRYILDAAKILLDAGADPLYREDDQSVLEWIGMKTSAAIPVDDSLEQECLFWVLYDLLEAKSKGEPYQEIDWCDVAVGRRIERIYSAAETPEMAVFQFTTENRSYLNCFKSNLVFVCEGILLSVTQYCHAYVNPYQLPSAETSPDLSGPLGMLIGRRIERIGFETFCKEEKNVRSHRSELRIWLDDGSCFQVSDNGDCPGEEYCAMFQVRRPDRGKC